jgi:hypothetical protein
LYEIVKVQAIASLLLFVVGGWLLRLLGISELYLPLLYVDVIGASLQVVLLGVLNIYFYLDRRREVLMLTGTFVVLNFVLTRLTLSLGPAWYGYGFAVSLLIVVALALYLLDRKRSTRIRNLYAAVSGASHLPRKGASAPFASACVGIETVPRPRWRICLRSAIFSLRCDDALPCRPARKPEDRPRGDAPHLDALRRSRSSKIRRRRRFACTPRCQLRSWWGCAVQRPQYWPIGAASRSPLM